MADPIVFLLAVLTLLATPGPTNTLLATAGGVAGIRASLPLLLAELCGYLVSIGTIRLVLGPALAAAPALATGLKVAVAAYLAYLAIALWRSIPSGAAPARRVTFSQVMTTTLLNPKALVFGLTVFPAAPPVPHPHLVIFCVSVPACGLLWIGIGRGLGSLAGSRRTLLPRLGAVALGGFAVALVAAVLAQ